MIGEVMQFDPATVSDQEFSLLPEGIYRVMINATALKANKNSDGSHVSVEFQVVDGVHKGRKLWHNFNVANPNEKAQNIGRAQMKKFLAAIGITTAIDMATQLPTLAKSKTLYVGVEHVKDFRDETRLKEEIKRFDASPGSVAIAQAAAPSRAQPGDSVPF
jgi:hypothetical protein